MARLLCSMVVVPIALGIYFTLAQNVRGAAFYAEAAVNGQLTDPGLGVSNQPFGKTIDQLSDPDYIIVDTGNITNDLGTVSGQGQANASAGAGRLAVYADAENYVYGPGGGSTVASALAGMYDNVYFTTLSGPTGSFVTVQAHWDITGAIGTFATNPNPFQTTTEATAILTAWGSAFGDAHAYQSTQLLVADSGTTINSIQNEDYLHPAPLTIPVTLTIEVGLPYFLEANLTASVTTDVGTSGTLTASSSGIVGYGHTLAWGGIDSVTDADGNLITDWSITSGSGFDYSKPYSVPEPSTFVLLGLGALTLAAGRLCRKPRHVTES